MEIRQEGVTCKIKISPWEEAFKTFGIDNLKLIVPVEQTEIHIPQLMHLSGWNLRLSPSAWSSWLSLHWREQLWHPIQTGALRRKVLEWSILLTFTNVLRKKYE
jgi:hypothetical protein